MLLGPNLRDPNQPCTEFTSGIAVEVIANNTDAAFIPLTRPNVIVGSNIKTLNGTTFGVTQGALSDIARISTVSMYGAFTNGDGHLLFKNDTIFGGHHELRQNAGIGTYPSQDGDSGAPIVSRSTGQPKLVGVHAGSVCELEDTSAGQGLINVSTYERFCSDGSYYYKAFSAWEAVRSALGLR